MHSNKPNDKIIDVVNRHNPAIGKISIPLNVSHLQVAKASNGAHCIGIQVKNNIHVIGDTVTGKALAFTKEDMRMFVGAVKSGEFDSILS